MSTNITDTSTSHGRTPFDSIENSMEYVTLLREVIEQTHEEIQTIISNTNSQDADATRTIDGLRLVLYKLERLDKHMSAVYRNLNDLRMLRRMFQRERKGAERSPQK